MKTFLIVFFSLCLLAGVLGITGVFETEAVPVNQHQITFEEAQELTQRFQETSSEGATFGFEQNGELFRDVTGFTKQDDLTSLKVMYGLTTDGKVALVIYGYDSGGNLLDVILEMGYPCPPYCSPTDNISERR